MLRLRCFGDLLGARGVTVEVTAATPELGGPEGDSGEETGRAGAIREGAHGPDAGPDLTVQGRGLPALAGPLR